ncbi:histone-lysine N-methyltransferase SETMAR [Trichonephila clavipes]|nr:histone-lysine N-methyltransferase SETMAR [Trichonephila clavipes]
MDVSKELVRGFLLYDFKVGLLATASSHRICQAFGDSAVNERTARHWFQKFRSGDLSLCDKAQTGRPQALNDEALPQVARVARNTIQRLGWETLCHPPYSSDLAPSDYLLFHSLDNHLRGKSFTNEADACQALTDFFASHTSEFYRKVEKINFNNLLCARYPSTTPQHPGGSAKDGHVLPQVLMTDICHYAQEIELQLQLNSDLPSLQAPEGWYQGQPRVEGFTSVVFIRDYQPFASYSRHAIGVCSGHINMFTGRVINGGLFS